jgi:hypothetical protein
MLPVRCSSATGPVDNKELPQPAAPGVGGPQGRGCSSQNLRNQDKDRADTNGSIEHFGDDRSKQQQRDNGDQGVASAKSVFRPAEFAES